jgi:hypothetical protein
MRVVLAQRVQIAETATFGFGFAAARWSATRRTDASAERTWRFCPPIANAMSNIGHV